MATTIGSLDLASLKNLRDDLTQYFWFESNASATYGAGAHITLVPDTTFISNPTGQNILMNTDGFSIRNGLLPMMTLDNDSLDFNVVDTTEGTFITTAAFSSTSAQIGQRDGAHSIIDVDGMRVYASDGTTLLATMGFGEIYPDQPGVKSAYYTFGIRHPDEPLIGVYSFAEGLRIMATGFWSHAEGYYTEANGDASHAEGYYTKANAACSHAEGRFTETRGGAYHFTSSHASGLGTVVNGWGSTALGAYNEDDLQVDTFTYDGTTNTFKLTHPIGYNGLFDSLAYYVMVEIDGKELYPYERRYSVYYPTDDPTVVINPPPSEGATIKISYATTNNIFTIGNGTADNARSNALTVDWKGNVNLPTGKFSGIGETLTYNASNSGTNALEINNASSNVFTVDWKGNVEAKGEIHGTLANPTISIAASTGTLQSATVYRQGNVVQLLVSARNTSATASGGNVFQGTINTTALRPKMTTTSGTYYGSYALNATISTAGSITIRNADSRSLAAMTSYYNISFTYLID